MKWVRIIDHNLGETHAAEVPTGVIVRESQWGDEEVGNPAVALIFIPGLYIKHSEYEPPTLKSRT